MKNYLFAFAILVLASCQKEMTQFNVNDDRFTVIEGRVAFNSMEDFTSTITDIHEGKTSPFSDGTLITSAGSIFQDLIKTDFVNYASYPNVVNSITTDGEIYLEPAVDFLLLADIANENGLIQVENTVYKFTYNAVYSADAGYVNKLINGDYNHPSVEIMPITRKVQTFGNASKIDVEQCDVEYKRRRKTYKVSGELSVVNAPIYSEIRSQTKHRRKTWIGWIYKDTYDIWMNGDVEYRENNYNPTTTFFAVSDVGQLEAEVHQVIDFCINLLCDFEFETADVNHKAKCLDNNNRDCDTII